MRPSATLSLLLAAALLQAPATSDAETIPFTNFGGNYRAHPSGALWLGFQGAASWPWYTGPQYPPAPFWNGPVTFVEEFQFTDFIFQPDETLLIPYAATMTVEARGEANEVIGTMVFETPELQTELGDIDPNHAWVDLETGAFASGISFTRWTAERAYQLVEETGVFSEDDIRLVGDQTVSNRQLVSAPLDAPPGPQYSVSGVGSWVWAGQYEIVDPEPVDCDGDGTLSILDANCAPAGFLDATLFAVGLMKGDADGDGKVAFSDFSILTNNFGKSGQYTDGDFDRSGSIEFPDFLILSNNFSEPAAMGAVPEPSSLLLMFVGLLAVCLPTKLNLKRKRRLKSRVET